MSTTGELARIVGAELVGPDDVEVHDVVSDSRSVSAGSLFCCVPGALHDGHDHAPAAVRGGAVALVCERRLALDVAQLVVDSTRTAMGPLAAEVHGRPAERLAVVGVTGTNGKTTVVNMVASLVQNAGRTARTIGTLTGARTTPEAPELQRLLATFVDEHVEVVAMEVSSHALDQSRVGGIRFEVGVFTMLGIDHLDYHGTPEAYFAAKAKLFDPGRCRAAVVNVDDVHGRLLRDGGDGTVIGVSLAEAEDLRHDADGSTFRWRGHEVRLPLIGVHNVTNALLAARVAIELGVDEAEVARGLGELPQVPGRFERFGGGDAPLVVVDYAHTPDALEAALSASRDLVRQRGRVIAVFGCGGDRDQGKRPLMGAVACRGADHVVLTDDNPRSEDPSAIIEAIRSGCDRDVEVVPGRGEAIASAIAQAEPGDVVLVAGKGHETGQIVGDVVMPFDDRDAVRAALTGGAP